MSITGPIYEALRADTSQPPAWLTERMDHAELIDEAGTADGLAQNPEAMLDLIGRLRMALALDRPDFSESDWDRIYRGVDLLREKAFHKSKHGERPAVYVRLLGKIAEARARAVHDE